MKGYILNYSYEKDEGIISGPGDSRCKFSSNEWQHECPVLNHVNVDYVVDGEFAKEIYCTENDKIRQAIEEIKLNEKNYALEIENNEKERKIQKLNTIFDGRYRSSDQNIWKGVVAGIAHKNGWSIKQCRFGFVMTLILCPIYFFATKDASAKPVYVIIFSALCIFYAYASSAWRKIDTNSELANIYFQFKNKKSKESSIKTLNSIGTFMAAWAEASAKSEAERLAKKKVFSNVIACKKCGSSGSISSDSRDYHCPVCEATTVIHYNNDGSISSMR